MNSSVNKDLLSSGLLLPVMEEFYSLQGEGFNTGKPAYFLRIGGCDIGCNWCDVKESWNARMHPLVETSAIIGRASLFAAKAVVVTGGEPLLYNLDPLCKGLKENNIDTFLETSGAYPVTGTWDWICVSPKQKYPPREDTLRLAGELKVIVYDESDFTWAEHNAGLVSEGCHLYLQPEWSRFDTVLPLVVHYVLHHPKWKISLQSHKFMKIP